MQKKLYEFSDEHRAQLGPWAQRWIANAMSTAVMTAEDRAKCVEAANGLYAAAGLPAPKHVVFVPSPFVLRFAGGFAAAIHYARKSAEATREATWEATEEATRAATSAATEEATWEATRAATAGATEGATSEATRAATLAATAGATAEATSAATRAATSAATEEATWEATLAATAGATEGATSEATREATRGATSAATAEATRAATAAATLAATAGATWEATRGATRAATSAATEGATREASAATRGATEGATRARNLSKWYTFDMDANALVNALGVGLFGLKCAENAANMWQGGNQWSGYDSYLSFFQHVAKLDLDYSKWAHWEMLSNHSGPRIMHPEFCMISDRPEVLLVDDRNRPHCETGPFCSWRDGSALYAVHGCRVPAWIIEQPELITPALIEGEDNTEIRRIMVDIYERDDPGRYIVSVGELVDESIDSHGEIRQLWRKNITADEPILRVRLINSTPEWDGTHKVYWLRVHPECRPLLHPTKRDFGPPQKLTALNAVASTWGMTGAQYEASLLEES